MTTQRSEAFDPQARHVVIDLETLGVRSDCRIISLGAFAFGGGTPDATFYQLVRLSDGANAERTETLSTVEWWERQSPAARLALTHNLRQPLAVVLGLFSTWVLDGADIGQVRAWGNGDEFDLAILQDAYLQAQQSVDFGYPVPWEYWNAHNLRTFKACFPYLRYGTQPSKQRHNALHDARYEAACLKRCLDEWHSFRLWEPPVGDAVVLGAVLDAEVAA